MSGRQDLNNMISILVLCNRDGTILVTIEGTEFCIPGVQLTNYITWHKLIEKELSELLGVKSTELSLLVLNKFWIPDQKLNYLENVVFLVEITDGTKSKLKPSAKYRGKIKWCTEDEIEKFFRNNILKNVSILDYISLAKYSRTKPLTLPAEISFTGNLFEMTDSALVLGKSTTFELLVDGAKINRAAQEILYYEFLNICFPSYFMTFGNFSKFLHQTGWNTDEATSLFRSADLLNRNSLSFREFLYFIAVVEPNITQSGGNIGELRCRYIFRYFDNDKNGIWKPSELRKFIIYSRKIRKITLDESKVDNEIAETYAILQIKEHSDIEMVKFLRAVGELKIRGTSQMLRAPTSYQSLIKTILGSGTAVGKGKIVSAQGVIKQEQFTTERDFELATHTLKFDQNARNMKVDLLSTFQDFISPSSTRQTVQSQSLRRLSMNIFDQTSKSNELLKIIRNLATNNKKFNTYGRIQDLPKFIWGKTDTIYVAKLIIGICGQVKELFVNEKRLLNLQSPVYILGDLHGNFNDLLMYEQALWPSGISLCPSKFLFLGDYVDRGFLSLEVICYLFAHKLQCPYKLYMLRGNHEIQNVQSQNTFERELRLKFGDRLGNSVWNSINSVFDTMPLAAVIDSKLFCVHGGVPPPWICPTVSVIEDIPVTLSQPHDQSNLAWELMWNDPIRSDQVTEKIRMELLANDGFAKNYRRGTAHLFNSQALEYFLKTNGFSHLIRAHEVAEAGFGVMLKGKLLSMFSSSNYCGGQNSTACVLADQSKLRIIKLGTSKMEPL